MQPHYGWHYFKGCGSVMNIKRKGASLLNSGIHFLLLTDCRYNVNYPPYPHAASVVPPVSPQTLEPEYNFFF